MADQAVGTGARTGTGTGAGAPAGPRVLQLSQRSRIFAWALAAVSVVHLLGQLLSAGTVTAVSQPLLMPLVLGILLCAGVRGRLVTLSAVALGFSWLGDTVPRFLDGDAAFLSMVGLFLVAQVVYVVAFWPWRSHSVLGDLRRRWWPYAVVVLALVVACAPHAGSLLVPVLAYGLVLGLMAALATGVGRAVGIGGALFLASDALIALEAFAPWWEVPLQGFWVMLTYLAAQLMITLGVIYRMSR